MESNESRRVGRVQKELQQIISQFLIRGFKHSLPGLVSVTRVKVTNDLRQAKVYVSVLGDEQQRDRALEVLVQHAWDVQKVVNREIKTKFTPQIRFYWDETADTQFEVNRLLSDLKAAGR